MLIILLMMQPINIDDCKPKMSSEKPSIAKCE